MGQTDRPDDRRAAGSRLPSNSESAVKRNHETPKSGIPKRKKIEACPRLSCKIQYLLASNHRDQSTTSEYFTDDSIVSPGMMPVLARYEANATKQLCIGLITALRSRYRTNRHTLCAAFARWRSAGELVF